jgi:enamine deaminase RidA (YjgF/YER057c/UK114 family)
MPWRESFVVPPNVHQNPIPSVSRIGNMVFTSAISGRDLETNQVPSDPAKTAENCFANLRRLLEKAGARPEHVGHVTVFLGSTDLRVHVNKPWVEMFPEENNRPARHAIIDPNLGPNSITIEAIAVIGG